LVPLTSHEPIALAGGLSASFSRKPKACAASVPYGIGGVCDMRRIPTRAMCASFDSRLNLKRSPAAFG
jgi:hypothetical protein